MYPETPEQTTTGLVSPELPDLGFDSLYKFRTHQDPLEKSGALTVDDPNRSFGLSQEELDSACEKEIPSHRPLKPVLTSASPSRPNSFREARTPRGTTLKRAFHIGPTTIYSNALAPATPSIEPSSAPFYTISDSAVLPAPESGRKYQERVLTREIYDAIVEERKQRARRSQSATIGRHGRKKHASANKEAALLGLTHERNFEWLHLIAHFMSGIQGQIPENLVGGTDAANTAMMFVEEQIPKLLAQFAHGIIVKVAADLLPATDAEKTVYTQFARTIYYAIEIIQPDGRTKPFKTFTFNALMVDKPNLTYQRYTSAYFQALMLKVRKQLDGESADSLSDLDVASSLPEPDNLPNSASSSAPAAKKLRLTHFTDSDDDFLTSPGDDSGPSATPSQDTESFAALFSAGLFSQTPVESAQENQMNEGSNIDLLRGVI